MRHASWFENEAALQRIVSRQLGVAAYARAQPRLSKMGDAAANEGATWAQQADRHGPTLVGYDRAGTRIDEIEYHQSYRSLQQLGYGGGIVAATWHPALSAERGLAPKALTFGLGYLFAQAELGMYCPVCMTDGSATLINQFASAALRARYLPKLGSVDLETLNTGAMFLTEKQGGSDVGQVLTVAKGSGERVTLFGDKWFCSNVDADVILALARPEGAGPGTRGLGLYLIPRTLDDGSRNRYRINRLKEKLGNRSFPSGEVTLEGAEATLLGGPGEGFHQMTEMLNLSRIYNAVASVAAMRRSVTEALDWAEQRIAFGRVIIEHPLMTETLMDLVSEQRLALNWVFRGIELLDRVEWNNGTDAEKRTLRVITPLLKYLLGKHCVRMASEAVEVLGGNGYIEDWPIARVLRDAQVLPIWEGTTNVLVLDAIRAVKKNAGYEVLFAELERAIGDAPPDLQPRLAALFDELKGAFGDAGQDLQAEYSYKDWADRAALLWMTSLSCSKSHGYGGATDVRAARRVLARWAPVGLMRKDRATVDDVRAIART